MSYFERLLCYEREKRKIIRSDWSAEEYEEIIRRLAEKWKV